MQQLMHIAMVMKYVFGFLMYVSTGIVYSTVLHSVGVRYLEQSGIRAYCAVCFLRAKCAIRIFRAYCTVFYSQLFLSNVQTGHIVAFCQVSRAFKDENPSWVT